MAKVISLLILVFFFSPSYGATVYQWVDHNGTYNFTDDHEKIPSAYHNQVRVKKMEDFPAMAPPALPSTPTAIPRKEEAKKAPPAFASTPTAVPQKEEGRKDILGLGEEWWREKVHPWEIQLREASKNYEAANKEFLKESDLLLLRKFGSPQQFKSTFIGMNNLKWVRAKYEAEVIQAEEMLEKISREAEELKADPGWLTGASTSGQRASLHTAEVDIYGQEEEWREKVLIQREQVKEAVENYEKVYEEYNKEAEKLGPYRFGGLSLTQYQFTAIRLQTLRGEMARYQSQISEATGMLKRLLAETEESEADPDWLK
jgi:hypothetical protein